MGHGVSSGMVFRHFLPVFQVLAGTVQFQKMEDERQQAAMVRCHTSRRGRAAPERLLLVRVMKQS
jgi:hypothetical protein